LPGPGWSASPNQPFLDLLAIVIFGPDLLLLILYYPGPGWYVSLTLFRVALPILI